MTESTCSPEPIRTYEQTALTVGETLSHALLHNCPTVLAPDEIASLLGHCTGTVLEWVRSGALPAVKIGSSTALVLRRDLHSFITDRLLAPEA